MSIIVKLFTDEELENILKGDLWLRTLLGNKKPLLPDEWIIWSKIKHTLHHYQVLFDGNKEGKFEEPTSFYAPNEEMLYRLLREEYIPKSIGLAWEVKISYLDIPRNLQAD
jgi:hypothetical protein